MGIVQCSFQFVFLVPFSLDPVYENNTPYKFSFNITFNRRDLPCKLQLSRKAYFLLSESGRLTEQVMMVQSTSATAPPRFSKSIASHAGGQVKLVVDGLDYFKVILKLSTFHS